MHRVSLEACELRHLCSQMVTGARPVISLWRRVYRGEEGNALIETAIILPLLITLLTGIFWLGRAYSVYETMSHSAREGARFAVSPTCVMCGNQSPTDDEIRQVVTRSLEAAALDPALTDPSPISVERNVILNAGSSMTERGVVISFNYPYQFLIPFTDVSMTTITLSTRVQMRQE